jgi:polar amino acid transport system substrate-binding protein
VNKPDLAVDDITVQEDTGGSAVAVKKNNPDLVEAINKTLKRIIDDGYLDQFVKDANDMNVTEE